MLKLQNSRQPLKIDPPLSCWRGPLSHTPSGQAVDVGWLCGYDRDAGAPNSSSTAHLKYINIVYNIIISNWETTKAIPQIQVTCIINCCLWHGMVELIATNHVYTSSGVSAYNFYPSKYQISFLSVLRCKSKTPPSSFSSAHNLPPIIASLWSAELKVRSRRF